MGGLDIVESICSIPNPHCHITLLSPPIPLYANGIISSVTLLQLKSNVFLSLSSYPNFIFDTCQLGKHHHVYFLSSHTSRSSCPFHHTDLWGPCFILVRDGHQYFITFIDNDYKICWLFFVTKSVWCLSCISQLLCRTKKFSVVSLQVLHANNALEYTSSKFHSFY